MAFRWAASSTVRYQAMTMLVIILAYAADIDCSQAELLEYQGVGHAMPAPYRPQHIAQQESPETDIALVSGLRTYQPGSYYRNQQSRPLQQINHVHGRLVPA